MSAVNEESLEKSLNKAARQLKDAIGRHISVNYSRQGHEASIKIDGLELFGGSGRSIDFACEAFFDGVTVGSMLTQIHGLKNDSGWDDEPKRKSKTGRRGAKIILPENVFDSDHRKRWAKEVVRDNLTTESVLILIRQAFVAGMKEGDE